MLSSATSSINDPTKPGWPIGQHAERMLCQQVIELTGEGDAVAWRSIGKFSGGISFSPMSVAFFAGASSPALTMAFRLGAYTHRRLGAQAASTTGFNTGVRARDSGDSDQPDRFIFSDWVDVFPNGEFDLEVRFSAAFTAALKIKVGLIFTRSVLS